MVFSDIHAMLYIIWICLLSSLPQKIDNYYWLIGNQWKRWLCWFSSIKEDQLFIQEMLNSIVDCWKFCMMSEHVKKSPQDTGQQYFNIYYRGLSCKHWYKTITVVGSCSTTQY